LKKFERKDRAAQERVEADKDIKEDEGVIMEEEATMEVENKCMTK
jgi:hypothetical protein